MIEDLMKNDLVRVLGSKIKSSINIISNPNKYSSDRYVSFLRSEGVAIGDRTEFFSPTTCHVDVTRPCLVTIGSDVKITRGTTLLTHDYGWNVLRNKYGEILGSAGRVKVNDNVFIGNNTTVLKNTEIGKNTIIAANSLVNKDIPPNVVAGGHPAEPIMGIEEFYEKRKQEYIKEAKVYAKSIEERYNRKPKEEDFGEFFPLFLKRKRENIHPEFLQRLTDGGMLSENQIDSFLESEPNFNSFDEFLEFCDI